MASKADIGPALLLSVMVVAAVSVHWGHGIELPLLYAIVVGAAAIGAIANPALRRHEVPASTTAAH